MDAVKFIEERNRMCRSSSPDCEGCRIDEVKPVVSECVLWVFDNPKRAVEIVEEWSAAHPRKTRQSVFLEMFPNVMKYENPHDVDIIAINPCCVNTKLQGHCPTGRGCDICRREFWMQEVE